MAKALVNSEGKVLLRNGKVATTDSVDCCCTPAGCGNDDFADALQLSGVDRSPLVVGDDFAGTVACDNTGFTVDPGHVDAFELSAWYVWTAPSSDDFTFDTIGTVFTGVSPNSVLAVYTGTEVDALTQIAFNDDAVGIGLLSQVTFTAVEGTVYHIALGGFDATQFGPTVLNWARVATCGCDRTVSVSVVSVVSITREGDPYMSMTTSFSHSFPSNENDEFCESEYTAFNSCIAGCSNDGRYPDPDAPVYAGEAIFIRNHCEHFPSFDRYVRVIVDICNTCTQPADPCDDSLPFCSSDNIGGGFDYDPVPDGVNVFNEHFDADFTTDFHYVESRDTTVTITVS